MRVTSLLAELPFRAIQEFWVACIDSGQMSDAIAPQFFQCQNDEVALSLSTTAQQGKPFGRENLSGSD